MNEPQACPDCVRRAWLLAHLAPYIERAFSGTSGLLVSELLRLSSEDLATAVAPEVAEQALTQASVVPESRLRADLIAAQCWATCRHDDRYPAGLRAASGEPWALIVGTRPCSTASCQAPVSQS
jgi:hypothetical protein